MEANVENFHVDLEAYKVIASITYLFGLKSNRVAYSLTLGNSLVTTLVVILQVAIFPRKRGAYISLNNEYLFSVIYASLFFAVYFVETFERLAKTSQFLNIFKAVIKDQL